jgi:catechol 2,3-dioxygenase-like lactoylglutathione lyase family enzyme
MKKMVICTTLAAALALPHSFTKGQNAVLSPPGFHHLHLNSVDPDTAIDFYTRQFPTTSKSTWNGIPALKSPNNVLVLFSKVATAPPVAPQSAIWHFGWHVTDVRRNLASYKGRPDIKLLPLYTGDQGRAVLISSDTWPGSGGVLGLTKAQISEAKAKSIEPKGGDGFAYMQGPDGAIIEYLGNQPHERMNHVHMWQEQPFCAQLWYLRHLNAAAVASRTAEPARGEADCTVARGPDRSWPSLEPEGTFRIPTAAVTFGDVALTWYMRQGEEPLVGTRGQLYDHIALSVANLDAWIAKLHSEAVNVLTDPYQLGGSRAVMIEGPSREAIELVEIK